MPGERTDSTNTGSLGGIKIARGYLRFDQRLEMLTLLVDSIDPEEQGYRFLPSSGFKKHLITRSYPYRFVHAI